MKQTVIALLALTGLWWITAAVADLAFLPGPILVLGELFHQLAAGNLILHLGVSLGRVTAALVLAAVPALILGIAAGLNRKVDTIVSPVVYLLFPVPKVALLPVVLLFLGLGSFSKIVFVVLIIYFQFYLGIRDETGKLDARYFDSLASLGGTTKDVVFHLVLPAILPRFFSTLRLTLGTAIAVLFFAETFATRLGAGWFIMDAWSRFAYTQMYAGIAALSLAALVLFFAVDVAEKKLCGWTYSERQGNK